MKSVDKIPSTKIKRATKILGTGAKVGVNYAKYYGNRIIKSKEEAKKKLDKDNAEDIYNSLQELKGSALKMAQMMSMDKNVLPEAYSEKFSLSQFSVPPLSYALVQKTFLKEFEKSPLEIFDSFNKEATHAASIGQVHMAKLKDKKYAVKVQYPGVGDSIKSDLALIKPMAKKLFNIKGKDSDKYFKEVEKKLVEETNYKLELENASKFKENCKELKDVLFPKYYKEFSSKKVLTMDWMDGVHLSEINHKDFSQEHKNKLGQIIWDFYMFQFHKLNEFQADPHPGNFLVNKKNQLIALDFGCTKAIPKKFYKSFSKLLDKDVISDKDEFNNTLFDLDFLLEKDSKSDKKILTEMLEQLLELIARPFHTDNFDFSDELYFKKIAITGEQLSKDKRLRKLSTSRGSKHFIYVNRTFFGLYNILHLIGAQKVEINGYKKYLD